MTYIYALIKFFDKPEYAQDFMSGKLYANRLSYFKEIEGEDGGDARSDKHEGVSANWQLDQGKLVLNGHRFTNGSAIIQMNWLDHLNVFCLHAIHGGDFELTSENLDDFKEHLKIPEEGLRQLGRHAVAITDGPQFIDRVKAEVEAQGYLVWNKLVKYYDSEIFHGVFGKGLNSPEAAFNKRDKYRWQREYRFVFHTRKPGTEAITLDIGDISDISFPIDIADINRTLEIGISG